MSRMLCRQWVVSCLAFTVACSAPTTLPVEDSGIPCTTCNITCPPGFSALDGGAGCFAVRPLGECDAGTAPSLGSTACLPVGVRSCAAGFVTDSSGWGCRDVISATPCTGATREKLGSTTCVPVSDCNAVFPPAGATMFVSPQFTAAQLDATHHNTIKAAVLVADAGAIIAIDEGTYVGTIVPQRSMSLVGRCAEKVIVVVPDGGTNIGVLLVDLTSVVKNLTLKGFPGGLAVYGGSAELSGLVIEASTIGGVIVSNPGTTVTMRDSAVRGTRARPTDRQAVGAIVQKASRLTLEEVAFSDNEFAGVVATNPDAGIVLRRSVVRGGFPIGQGPVAGTFGVGVYSVDGAWLEVEESAVLDNTTEGVLVARGGTRPGSLAIRRSTVRDTRPNPATENFARGIEAGKGASLLVEGCTVMGNREHEILVTEGANAVLTDTTTVGSPDPTQPSGTGMLVGYDAGVVATSLAFVRPHAVGIAIETNGALRLEDSLITDPVLAVTPGSTLGPQAFGISQKTGGALTMVRGAVRRAQGVGILLSTATASLNGALVLDTQTRYLESGRAISVQDGSTFTAMRSAFVGSHEAGIITFDLKSFASLNQSSVEATQPDGHGDFGIGVLATTGSTLEVNACTLTGNRSIGIAASAAGAVVRGSYISFNQTGLHAQDGVSIFNGETVELRADGLSVTNDTRFIGNSVLSGLGSVPLPSK